MKKLLAQDESFIISYLRKLNLKPSRDIDQFWKNIYQKYGKKLGDKLDSIVRARAEGAFSDDLYEVKNESLELSLDFAMYSADLYRRYFEWLIDKKELNPKRILDIGCDNGIVTCFYGLLFPNSEVIGMDISDNSIKCAQLLAAKLGLSNVVFKKIDIKKVKEKYSDSYFDMITSIRSLHEIIGEFAELKYWSLNDIDIDKIRENMVVKLIVNLLNSEAGIFVSWERISDAGRAVLWIEELRHEGLYVDWDKSHMIKFHEVGDNQQMPVFVFTKTDNRINTIEGISILYTKDRLMDINVDREYTGDHAEITFLKIEDKQLIRGLQINYANGSGNLRFELWRTNNQLLTYQYSNVGYRDLKVLPLDIESTAIDKLDKVGAAQSTSGNKVIYYNSIKDRD